MRMHGRDDPTVPVDVGDLVKVMLPRESPWAEVIEVLDDGNWIGRFNSIPLLGDHHYEDGDLVLFSKQDFNGNIWWAPMPTH
jgi:hypothetical protein